MLSIIIYSTTKVFPKKFFYDSVVIFEKTIVSWLRYALTQCMLRLWRFINCHGSSDGRAGGYELGGPEVESLSWIHNEIVFQRVICCDSIFLDPLIRHLELHFRASMMGGVWAKTWLVTTLLFFSVKAL